MYLNGFRYIIFMRLVKITNFRSIFCTFRTYLRTYRRHHCAKSCTLCGHSVFNPFAHQSMYAPTQLLGRWTFLSVSLGPVVTRSPRNNNKLLIAPPSPHPYDPVSPNSFSPLTLARGFAMGRKVFTNVNNGQQPLPHPCIPLPPSTWECRFQLRCLRIPSLI